MKTVVLALSLFFSVGAFADGLAPGHPFLVQYPTVALIAPQFQLLVVGCLQGIEIHSGRPETGAAAVAKCLDITLKYQ